MKRVIGLIVVAMLLLVLSGCQESTSSKYERAQSLLAENKFSEAAEVFSSLGSYEDAAKLTMYCKAAAAGESGDYETAVKAFLDFGDYKESSYMAAYYQARALEARGLYLDAIDAYKQISLFRDSTDRIKACQDSLYAKAAELKKDGKYYEAYVVYSKIKGYKDVDNIIVSDENIVAAAAAREAKLASFKTVGSIVTFGRYEQDNNTENGQEEIEWIVLDVQDGKSLLLSRYGLDAKPYNTESEDITWEQCTLRKWLNGDFLKSAFTEAEQSVILLTNVDNSKAQGYSGWSTDGGNNTQDQMFLLSYAEANKYLDVSRDNSNNQKSPVAPTAWAKAQSAKTSESYKTADGEPAGWWWLRSPGYYQSRAAYVGGDGSLYNRNVSFGNLVVRPALWLNLESGIF